MKIVKVLFIFALVSMIAVSCKETKKEEVQDDAAVEMTEESNDDVEEVNDAQSEAVEESTEDSGGAAAAAAAGAAAASTSEAPATKEVEESEAAAEVIEAEVVEVEELVIPAGVIAEEMADTPVVYPGCTGSEAEIRACNKESFIAFLKKEFNHDIGKEAGLKRGDYEIRTVVHIDTEGKLSALRVTAPDNNLKIEMKRVISKVPQVVPATEGGKPVAVTFILPIDFRVEKL